MAVNGEAVAGAEDARGVFLRHFTQEVSLTISRDGQVLREQLLIRPGSYVFKDRPDLADDYRAQLQLRSGIEDYQRATQKMLDALRDGHLRSASRLVGTLKPAARQDVYAALALASYYIHKSILHKAKQYLHVSRDILQQGTHPDAVKAWYQYYETLYLICHRETDVTTLSQRIQTVELDREPLYETLLKRVNKGDDDVLKKEALLGLLSANPFRHEALADVSSLSLSAQERKVVAQLKQMLSAMPTDRKLALQSLQESCEAYLSGDGTLEELKAAMEKVELAGPEKVNALYQCIDHDHQDRGRLLSLYAHCFTAQPTVERARHLLSRAQSWSMEPYALKVLYDYCAAYDMQDEALFQIYKTWRSSYYIYARAKAPSLLKEACAKADDGLVEEAADDLIKAADQLSIMDLKVSAALLLQHHGKLTQEKKWQLYGPIYTFWDNMSKGQRRFWKESYDICHFISRTGWHLRSSAGYARYALDDSDPAILVACAICFFEKEELTVARKVIRKAEKLYNDNPNHHSVRWIPCIIKGKVCMTVQEYLCIIAAEYGMTVDIQAVEQEPADTLDDF